MVKDDYMSNEKFKNLIDSLVDDYKEYKNPPNSILEFLDIYFDKELVMQVNPIDLICELHKCNEEGFIMMKESTNGKRCEFTIRFNILMGICELIEFCTRPTAKFKYRDIITNGKFVWYVMNVDDEGSKYYVDDLNGNPYVFSFKFVNPNCKKIGEVTDDVIKNVNRHYKSK